VEPNCFLLFDIPLLFGFTMKGSPPEDCSTGDESSDIRTVRSNATHIFSQSSHYTNPTLPASVLERLESDDVSSLGGPDYASPTSIMTNYESYSKFGAAPIYQTVPSASSKPTTSGNNMKELKTIAEESPTVYQAPSFYKSQRRTGGKRHGENISNIAISASKNIAASSKSVEDGSTLTEKTTTSSSRSSATEDPAKASDVKSSATPNTFSMMFKRITSSSKSPARNRNASPIPETIDSKKSSPIAQSVRHHNIVSKSFQKSPPNSIVGASSATHGRDSPPPNVAVPKSIQIPPGNSKSLVSTQNSMRPTTPTEPIRLSESQTSTPRAGVHSPSAPAAAPYINPTLKSVSSKLFVQEAPEARVDPSAPKLNLAVVDDASPKKFRLWTDEDSAIGTTWYNFQEQSFFAASPASNLDRGHLPSDNFQGQSSFAASASPPPASNLNRGHLPSDTPSTLTTEAPVEAAASAAGPKLSLSRLQMKQMHRGTSTGTVTITDEDTMNSRGGYPSMVSSEYEDEGGTYNGDMTDDFTTLGGGPSLDFSLSACIDEESPNKNAALPPIVYSNVGQALSRSDQAPPVPLPKNAFLPGVLSSTLDRPQRVRRSSSMSTSKHSSTLEIIEEYGAPVASLGPKEDSAMVLVSLADPAHQSSTGRSMANSEAVPREKVVVIRKLDAVQIGIIVLISVALAAVICATFCLVGSCQVGGRRRMLLRGTVIPHNPSTKLVAAVDNTASLFSLTNGN
jgi:hypothetical protein